jgi:hypothetical protein
MRHCKVTDYADQFTTFDCHNEPTYLLSRTCTEDYYGANGPCCKVDVAINYLVNHNTELFSHIKFMMHSDDDMYYRPDQLLKWLALVDNSGANEYPLIANLQYGDDNHKGVWHIKGCDEVRTTGWYQPAMLNHKLLERMGVASAAYGLKDTCAGFDVTHDVGLGIFAWMFGPYHIKIPNTEPNGDHQGYKIFKPDQLAVHCIKHGNKDRCDGSSGWPNSDRYVQSMVVGCGNLTHPVHTHDSTHEYADMYDAWNYFKKHGKDVDFSSPQNEFITSYVVVGSDQQTKRVLNEHVQLTANGDDTFGASPYPLIDGTYYTLAEGEKVVQRTIPRMMRLKGYAETKHGKENDITKNWVPFGMKSCVPAGKVG